MTSLPEPRTAGRAVRSRRTHLIQPPSPRELLRAQAAVLVWFDAWWLDVPGDSDEVDEVISEFLIEDCRRVRGPDGAAHWALVDSERRRALRDLGPQGAADALRRTTINPTGPAQSALSRAIDPPTPTADGEPPTLESLSADLQVARWLGDAFPAAQNVEDIEAALAREELLAPLKTFGAHGFYGRTTELGLLQEHLFGGTRPLVISGVGGVGKSTLLAKFITGRTDGLFAYLNFDRGALEADRPAQLMSEILRQLTIQQPVLSERLRPLIDDLRVQENTDEETLGLSSHASAPTSSTRLSRSLIARAAKLITPYVRGGLLVVLDTFEEVQRRRITDLYVLKDFLDQLLRLIPMTRIVIAGRALDTGLGAELDATVISLTELDHTSAVQMILDADGVAASVELAERTIGLVGRNPLSLRLAIEILRVSQADDPLLDLELQEGQIQGVLYRRILMHIDNREVRRIAHPGLVVRVVTPDVIRHVLAKPCGITVKTDRHANELFRQLEREATLVTSDGRSLRHRADVRKLMLPKLQRDQKPQVAKIHRAAYKYYARLRGPAARAEELYHRLMLGQTSRTLDAHWDKDALPSLLDSIDELPARGQQYLWAQAEGRISLPDEIMREADDQTWAAATAPLIAAELRAGRPEVALDLAHERRGPNGESLVPSAEVEALEAFREFDEALRVLRGARDAALRRRRSEEAVSLTLDVMRVLERMQRFLEAVREASELRDALRAGYGESALDYLVATTSYLRLLRRSGRQDSPEYAEGVADAVQKAENLTLRELGSRPGLTRELLAEIGTASEKLLRFGIEQVGVARGQTERLDSELAKVDATTGSGPYDDDEDDDDEDGDYDDEPLVEPRSRTASKVAEYLNEVGPDDDLSHAISESWQVETDGLYS